VKSGFFTNNPFLERVPKRHFQVSLPTWEIASLTNPFFIRRRSRKVE